MTYIYVKAANSSDFNKSKVSQLDTRNGKLLEIITCESI